MKKIISIVLLSTVILSAWSMDRVCIASGLRDHKTGSGGSVPISMAFDYGQYMTIKANSKKALLITAKGDKITFDYERNLPKGLRAYIGPGGNILLVKTSKRSFEVKPATSDELVHFKCPTKRVQR